MNDFITQFKKADATQVLFTQDAKYAVSAPEGKPVTLSGYALLWNELSSDRGGYRVRLKPYSATVRANSLALFHHDSKLVIGNTVNGTLRYSSDETGLKVEIDLPNTTTGRDVAELVSKKYMQGMSFGMLLDPEPEMEGLVENGVTILELSKFTLKEVTVTADPAFSQTSIGVKPPVDPEFSQKERCDRLRRERVQLERLNLSMLGT